MIAIENATGITPAEGGEVVISNLDREQRENGTV